MMAKGSLFFAGTLALIAAVGFAWFVRLPLPFPGFSVLVAATFAALGTLALIAWMPAAWIWQDAERLRHAFQARHGMSEAGAHSALLAVTTAHDRANSLRKYAKSMRNDVSDQIGEVADRLDASAREIFYVPERLRALRTVLARAELIEDAAAAHAALRVRNQSETENESRTQLIRAVEALEAAFDQTDLLAARGLLQEVEIASDVAERVLAPPKRQRSATQEN